MDQSQKVSKKSLDELVECIKQFKSLGYSPLKKFNFFNKKAVTLLCDQLGTDHGKKLEGSVASVKGGRVELVKVRF